MISSGLHHLYAALTNANFSLSNFPILAGAGASVWAYVKRKKIAGSIVTAFTQLGETRKLMRQLQHTNELLQIERAENSDWRKVIKNLRDQSEVVSEQLSQLQERLTEVEGMLEVKSANEVALFEDREHLLKENEALRKQLLANHIEPVVPQTTLFGLPPGDNGP